MPARTEPGLCPAFTPLAPVTGGPPSLTPQRRRLLLELLRRLGLDPAAPAGPGSSDSALAPIEEALSHRSAGRPVDHEQLEFLGDAVLRLAASLYLRQHHTVATAPTANNSNHQNLGKQKGGPPKRPARLYFLTNY